MILFVAFCLRAAADFASQWDKLAQRIGLERQARAVGLREYLARAATDVSTGGTR